MKTGSWQQIIFLAIFLAFMLIPSLSMVLPVSVGGVNTEWRTLAKFPDLKKTRIIDYPEEINAFFNDNFGFRQFLLKLYGDIKLRVFNTNPVQTDIIGKEGWLFHNPVNPPVYKPFYDHIFFSNSELENLKKQLVSDRDWLRKRGIEYILVIIPDKDVVYPEYHPYPNYPIFDLRLNQFLKYMRQNTDLNILYVKDALLQAKKENNLLLYYHGDTHWTSLGAFYGYREVMRLFQKSHPDVYVPTIDDFEVTAGGVHEDDLMRLNPEFRKEDRKIEMTLKKESAAKIKKLNKIYMYGDSFSINKNGPVPEGLIYFFPMSFDNVSSNHYSWDLDYEEIAKTKPELVIRESVERYIYDWTTRPNTSPPKNL